MADILYLRTQIDTIEGHAKDKKVSAALKTLREHCSILKILGSYPCVDEAVK
jgi:prephenate dehydratase